MAAAPAGAAQMVLTCCCLRSQVKSKSAVLTQEIAAVQTDRDELQKKYEAKSRHARPWHAARAAQTAVLTRTALCCTRSEKRQQDEHLSKLLAENQVCARAACRTRVWLRAC
jgi:hypothetical protein